MTEDEARDWLAARYPSPAIAKLERFVTLLQAEATRQSLIATSTIPVVWSRHIVDSAQLEPLGNSDGRWLDIGSGAGLPGLVIAILRDAPMVLSEPRRKRIDFLNDAKSALDLTNVTVDGRRAASMSGCFSIISARAVAALHDLFMWTERIVSRETRFLLPRGQSFNAELDIVGRAWHGRFHVEQSLTDPASGIVVANQVVRR